MKRADATLPSQTPESAAKPDRGYRIRVKGMLDARWSEWFGGLAITYEETSGETLLYGHIPDQAALHGVLIKIRDLNLDLILVERVT